MAKVIWITGLSGSGKSTIGKEVVINLRQKGENVIYLDGDELREIFLKYKFNSNFHVREERLKLAKQYSNLCKILEKQNFIVVIATISMFKEI